MKKLIKNTISRFLPLKQSTRPVVIDDETTILKRSDQFKVQYQEWKLSGKADEIINELKWHFLKSEPSEGSDFEIDFYSSPGANGFSVMGSEKVNVDAYRFLADSFKEKLLTMNYRIYSSTAERKNRVDRLIKLERHYLKPAAWSEEVPKEQLFGNILIELEIINDKVEYLKLLSTYYTGFDYKPAKSFEELVMNLLQ